METDNQADTQQLVRQIQGPHNCKASAVVLFEVLRRRGCVPLGKDVARLIATLVLKSKYEDEWL